MAKQQFLSETNYRILSWIFSILTILAVVALFYIIRAPHKVDIQLQKRDDMLGCQTNMYRLAKAEEKYFLDKGTYTDRKIFLLAYDEDADNLRCPTTGILYDIILEPIPADYTITEAVLTQLGVEKVPRAVRNKLGALKDQTFAGKESFTETLQTNLGEKDFNEYNELIIKAAQSGPDAVYSLECPHPESEGAEYANHGRIIRAVPSWLGHRVPFEESYTLTKKSLADLKKENIPEELLENLKKLEDKRILGRSEFLDAAKEILGEEHIEEYKDMLLNYAVKE